MPILNSEVQRETYIESGSDSWGDSNKYRRYHNVWKWLNTVRVYNDNHTHDAYYFAALKYAIPVGENRVIIYFHSLLFYKIEIWPKKPKLGMCIIIILIFLYIF